MPPSVLCLCPEGEEGVSTGVRRLLLWGQHHTPCLLPVEVGVWFPLNREDGGSEAPQAERQARIKPKTILEDPALSGGWYTSRQSLGRWCRVTKPVSENRSFSVQVSSHRQVPVGWALSMLDPVCRGLGHSRKKSVPCNNPQLRLPSRNSRHHCLLPLSLIMLSA